MFEKIEKRYMTRAIGEEVHPEIATILWKLIDAKRQQNVDLDYLQVFELSVQDGKQAIIQRQEVFEMRSLHILPIHQTEPITSTIWCIDSGETEMMLYPEDY